jgi:hypothetical protein
MDDGFIKLVKGCPEIQELTLDNTRIDDFVLLSIGNKLSALQKISLINCKISDRGIDSIVQVEVYEYNDD